MKKTIKSPKNSSWFIEFDGVKSFQIWMHLVFISRFTSYIKKKKKKRGRPVKAHEAQTVQSTLDQRIRRSRSPPTLRPFPSARSHLQSLAPWARPRRRLQLAAPRPRVYRAGATVSRVVAGSARSRSVTVAYRPAAAVYRSSFGGWPRRQVSECFFAFV
jgi:hypothetical protein